MAEEAKTYGEFIAAMEKTEHFGAQIFIEIWKALATEAQWQEYRPMPLTKELVFNFAEDMANYFRNRISNIETEALYLSEIEESHAFLREIWEKATAFGIDVQLEEIDTWLTPTEIMLDIGLAKIVPADTSSGE